MKTVLLALTFFLINLNLLHSQSCTLQNPSFELYNPLVIGQDTLQVPANYNPFISLVFSIFAGGVPGIDTTHDAQSGNLALRLFRDTANNVPIGGDAISIIPCNSYVTLSGFYKLENPGPNDSALIGITATYYDQVNQRRDTVIDEGIFLGAAANYTAFSFTPLPTNLTLPIDTVILTTLYFPQGNQTSFKLDNLSLTRWAVNLEESSKITNEFKVYPNPAKDFIVVENAELGKVMQLMNMSGQILIEQQIISKREQLELDSYPQGIYFLRVGEQIQKVVLSK